VKKARCYTSSTAMRYYSEWLDGEYVLLNHAIPGYNHSNVMQRAIRFHALFGSTIVLSDTQMVDFRNPIPTLFGDRHFRTFLKEKNDFLALVADPARWASGKFAIAIKGIERLHDQANKPEDSYEMAVTQLGEPIFRPGAFDADKYLNPRNEGKGRVGRVIKRFKKEYGCQLKGLLHAVDYFSRGPLPTTTMSSKRSPERYDTLLRSAQKTASEEHAKRIQKILDIQEQKLPEKQHGRRAAIRKLLGTGQWHHEHWKDEDLRLYLDVVHAWNCAINRNIAPEAGTLYESRGDIPLSRYERTVTDTVGWFRAGPMPSSDMSDHIRHLLSWDPLTSDWKHIAHIVNRTQKTAEKLQAALNTGNMGERAEALRVHASEIAEYLPHVPPIEIPRCVWAIAKTVTTPWDGLSEVVDVAEKFADEAPYDYAIAQQKLIVNTLRKAGTKLL
jgi:hypothetical protein